MLEIQKLKKQRRVIPGKMLISAFNRGNQNHEDTELARTSRGQPEPQLNSPRLGTASFLFKMSSELQQTVSQRNKRMCFYLLQALDSWSSGSSKSESRTMKYKEFLDSPDLLWWTRLTSACLPTEIMWNKNFSQMRSGPCNGNSCNSKARTHKFQSLKWRDAEATWGNPLVNVVVVTTYPIWQEISTWTWCS